MASERTLVVQVFQSLGATASRPNASGRTAHHNRKRSGALRRRTAISSHKTAAHARHTGFSRTAVRIFIRSDVAARSEHRVRHGAQGSNECAKDDRSIQAHRRREQWVAALEARALDEQRDAVARQRNRLPKVSMRKALARRPASEANEVPTDECSVASSSTSVELADRAVER
jgi:hypothetical protein